MEGKMSCWSAENATNAYLGAMRMGMTQKEPNGSEFISALAAGNNAQLMVVACGGAADSTTLALAAAAQQTGGRIVCIVRNLDDLQSSTMALEKNVSLIEFVIGDAEDLLLNNYRESDFVAVDCNLENHESIIAVVQELGRKNNTIVVGYNAFCKDSWRTSYHRTDLLPIGEGLLVTRIGSRVPRRSGSGSGKKNWIVKVDKCTGEEHVFRVRSSMGRVIRT